MSLDRLRSVLSAMNLREVARGAGVHPNTVYRLANGSGAHYETVRKIMDYLKSKGWKVDG